jgi:DNA mismatch repair ATPase MutS
MNFSSTYLKELQAILKKNMGAVKSLKRLNSIGEAVKVRYNGITYLICSGLLMWDYHCVHSFDVWKQTYGADIRKWLEVTGEIEALLSLAVLCNVKQKYCFPVVSESNTPKIKFENIKHPLINEQQSVGNSLKINAETCIITGSNMSGKTTFLRSVGTNLVLAYAGAPVLAESFEASKMTVFTSMRIEDNVSKGISTFYAELLRIKSIVDYSSRETPMLALVDEVFKGTNSADRIVGATETIKRLSMPWIITMVTTHDFELCNLENDSNVHATNYHFSESYVGNEIHFDYKIKQGRCKTTNAKHLLRMAGIL